MKSRPPEPQTPRGSLASQIRDILLERILQGGFVPGERLVEMRLAEEMQTSQAPVREALRELSTIGVVEYTKNRGTRVRAPDYQELREIYDVRAEIEGYAASLAARHLKGNTDELSEQIDEMIEAARTHDIISLANANARFHRIIVIASGNNTLLDIWSRLDVRTRTTMNFIRKEQDLNAIARSHLKIVEALNSGTPSLVRKVSQAHVMSFRPNVEIPLGLPPD